MVLEIRDTTVKAILFKFENEKYEKYFIWIFKRRIFTLIEYQMRMSNFNFVYSCL